MAGVRVDAARSGRCHALLVRYCARISAARTIAVATMSRTDAVMTVLVLIPRGTQRRTP